MPDLSCKPWPLDFINTLRGWNEMQEYCNHLDDEVCQTLSAIPDGDAFNDFPDDFQSTRGFEKISVN